MLILNWPQALLDLAELEVLEEMELMVDLAVMEKIHALLK